VTPGQAPITAAGTGVRLRIRVQPRASSNEVAGAYGDQIRVRLTAPPVDGAANEALVGFLAGRLGVERASVRIVAGLSSRSKVVEVGALGVEETSRRLGLVP
jgi:uncharacterized protein (TIGR00251 family)